jgi:hypothetical protein
MTLWFQGGSGLMSSSLGSLDLVKFKLAPACVDISDLVVNNEGSDEGLARMVSLLGGETQLGGSARAVLQCALARNAAVMSSNATCMQPEVCATTAAQAVA